MKRLFRALFVFLLLVTAFSGAASAAAVALTSVGQSPDAMMVRVVFRKLAVDVDYDALMRSDALPGHKVLVAVVGGSSKGLGAAGINQDQEKARSVDLVEKAREQGIKVLVMHVGGEGRRGTLSDLFIEAVVPLADHLILVEGADKDGLFTRLIEGKGIAVDTASTVRDTDVPLRGVLARWGLL